MLDIDAINDCLAFLGRTTLQGTEVPAFANLTNRLHYLRNHLIEEAKKEEERKAKPVPDPPATRRSRKAANPE